METLGEILDRLQERSEVFRLLEAADKGDLAARLNQAAAAAGCDPRDLALQAVHDYSGKADAEAWVTLIGRIQDAKIPAATCLSEMIDWYLKR